MDYGKPSPFELWRRENLSNMAVSKEILELIAKAFEDGQLSERKAYEQKLVAKDRHELAGTIPISNGGIATKTPMPVKLNYEWRGLTAKDLAEIPPSCYEGAIWADAKLREKNT
jgi:hypothetical protein